MRHYAVGSMPGFHPQVQNCHTDWNVRALNEGNVTPDGITVYLLLIAETETVGHRECVFSAGPPLLPVEGRHVRIEKQVLERFDSHRKFLIR